jgi:hypothetical protein
MKKLYISLTFTVSPDETDNCKHGWADDKGNMKRAQTGGEGNDCWDREVNTYLN